MKLDSYHRLCTKILTERIKDLHIRTKTIKLFEENTDIKLHNLGLGNVLLDMIPKVQGTSKKQ